MKKLICAAIATLACVSSFADSDSTKAKLERLKELLDSNLITKEEFASRKAALLDALVGGAKQSEKPVEFYCVYSGEKFEMPEGAEFAFSESADVRQMVKEILEEVAVPPNFVVQQGPIPNAMAMNRGPDRFIIYNPQFIGQVKGGDTNWIVYSVIAHEIGHHLAGHTLIPGGSRPDLELEADEFSGAVLERMNCSLEQAELAMKKFGTDADTPTHPGRAKRLAAIEKGWNKSKAKNNAITATLKFPATPKESPSDTKTKTKLCVHKIACTHLTACTHRTACSHQIPCSHQSPCQHTTPCQHFMPCQHIFQTPYGPRPAHQFDQMHPYDTMHQADQTHPYDLAHESDELHPQGDPVHDFDYAHPDGD